MSHLLWYPTHQLLIKDMVRAENCHVFDSRGRKYVDLESGVWCLPLGHSHPAVLRAITEQLSQIGHTGYAYSCAIAETAAQKVLNLLDFQDGKCVLLCAGSEAVEYVVRTAQTVMPAPLVMTMTDSYFGAYGQAAQKQAGEWYCFDWFPCADCPEERACDEACPRCSAIPFESIGAFLFEPGSSSGLVRFPPAKLIESIVRRVQNNGGFLLVNEVTTGMGRTGKWFGYQHYDVRPDGVALGKGVGNGYPVSVAAFSPRLMEKMGDRTLNYSQSHQNDPLGAAVVLAVINAIEEGKLLERCQHISGMLLEGLGELAKGCGRIKQVRGRGLMVAIELLDDAGQSFAIRVQGELLRRGYILARRWGVPVLRLDPSLTIEEEDISGFLRCFGELVT